MSKNTAARRYTAADTERRDRVRCLCLELQATEDPAERKRLTDQIVVEVIWPMIQLNWRKQMLHTAGHRLEPDDALAAAAERVLLYLRDQIRPGVSCPEIGIAQLFSVARLGVAREASTAIAGVPDSTAATHFRRESLIRKIVEPELSQRLQRTPTRAELIAAAQSLLRDRDGQVTADDLPGERPLVTVLSDEILEELTGSRAAASEASQDPLDRLIEQEEHDERRAQLDRAIATLTPREQAIVRGQFGDGEDYISRKDLAARFGLAETSVSHILSDAVQKLRVVLGEAPDPADAYQLAA
jgi:DNA-directed RNA polymerase specialized sigma24 family protein